MVAISAQNAQERQNTLIDHVLDTITRFDMNQDALVNRLNALLDAVWEDLDQLDQLATDVDRVDPDHPVNFLLDCLQEKVVSAIEAKSDDDFWAYAKENGVVFHERAVNDFLTPDELQSAITANEGNGGACMPAEEEERTRMVLAALLAMKALGTINGNIDVTPGGAIREGAVRRRPYNLIEYTAGDVPVQLFVCDEQKQAIYGLRGDNCLSKEAFFNSSNPVTKTFLQEIGGLQIKFNSQWRNKIQKFTEGLIESKDPINFNRDYVRPTINTEFLTAAVEAFIALNPGALPYQANLIRQKTVYLPVQDEDCNSSEILEVGGVKYKPTRDKWSTIKSAIASKTRGSQSIFPSGIDEYGLQNFLEDNEYIPKKPSISKEYLETICEIYKKINPGKKIKATSGDVYELYRGQRYVFPDDIIECEGIQYCPNGDTWNAIYLSFSNKSRSAEMLWPEGAESYDFLQWLHDNKLQKIPPDITPAYLHNITAIYMAMNNGRLPGWSESFGAVYEVWDSDEHGDCLSDMITVNGTKYVPNEDSWNAVGQAIRNGSRGARAVWPSDWDNTKRYGLSQWLVDNDYAKSKQPPTQATEGHDAAQLRARGGR